MFREIYKKEIKTTRAKLVLLFDPIALVNSEQNIDMNP